MKYTVSLVGHNSEGDPLTQVWGREQDALGVTLCVAQILKHKDDNDVIAGHRVFNGTIEIVEVI